MNDNITIISIKDNEGQEFTFEVADKEEEKLIHDMVRIARRHDADVNLVMIYLNKMINTWKEIINSQNEIMNSDNSLPYDYANTIVIRDIALQELRLDRLSLNFEKWIEAQEIKI